MTSRTANKFSPEVLDHETEPASRWAAITSISCKIVCAAQTLNE